MISSALSRKTLVSVSLRAARKIFEALSSRTHLRRHAGSCNWSASSKNAVTTS